MVRYLRLLWEQNELMRRIVYTQDVAGDFRARLDGISQTEQGGSEPAVGEERSERRETDEMAGFKASGFKSSGFKSSFKPAAPAAPAEGEDVDVDGEEIGEDIDGAPLDLDGDELDDVDGAPLEDVDGEELGIDVDGESLEEVVVDVDGYPMGGDVDDVDGAPIPRSDEKEL
jgi:U2-associated protein SR140